MNRVWQRIVEVGDSHRQRGEQLSEQQARSIVSDICSEERVEPPADDVLDYMAHALMRRTR